MQEIFVFIILATIGYVLSRLSVYYFAIDLPAIKFYIFSFLVPLFMYLAGIVSYSSFLHMRIPEYFRSLQYRMNYEIPLAIAGLIIGAFLDKLTK